MNDKPITIDQPEPHALGRRWFAGTAALAGLGLVVAGAKAQPAGGDAFMGGRGGAGLDPEKMLQHMERRIQSTVRSVNGTPEQTGRLMAISRSALTEIKPLREQHRQARREGLALLAAPTLDHAAIEQLRGAQLALTDRVSRRLTDSMVAAAEVFTPEQRAQLAQRMQRRQSS